MHHHWPEAAKAAAEYARKQLSKSTAKKAVVDGKRWYAQLESDAQKVLFKDLPPEGRIIVDDFNGRFKRVEVSDGPREDPQLQSRLLWLSCGKHTHLAQVCCRPSI